MGQTKRVKARKKFNYNKRRKVSKPKPSTAPNINSETLKAAWDSSKSYAANMHAIGLASDPNKAVGMKKINKKQMDDNVEVMDLEEARQKNIEYSVIKGLESETKQVKNDLRWLSSDDVHFCTHMLSKHGESYKAMARDTKNYYQLTPKQIKKKIETFKKTPQYEHYLKSRS